MEPQLQKLLQRRRKGAAEEEQQDSAAASPEEMGIDHPLGPQSNVSLLDQHQHLSKKAEGGLGSRPERLSVAHCFGVSLTPSASLSARKESAKEKQLKERGEDPGEWRKVGMAVARAEKR